MQRKRNKPSESKIRNATPNEYNGIKFKSKLETYTYKKLEESNIKAEYETQRYELLPAFTFGDKKYSFQKRGSYNIFFRNDVRLFEAI